jgi:predicted DNA-binding ribbon-helix-helix protein
MSEVKECCAATGPTTLVSRNVRINDRRTSIRLEPEMWMLLRDIGRRENMSIHQLCSIVHKRKFHGTSLTASIRVFIMKYFHEAATEQGHSNAGHGNLRVKFLLGHTGILPWEGAGSPINEDPDFGQGKFGPS